MSALKKTVQQKELGFVTVSLLKPGIIHVSHLAEEIISVEKGIELLNAVNELAGNLPYATIINMGDKYAPSKEFFKFIVSQRSPEKDHVVARALVTTNMASRIDAQNFIGFFKPLTPTKLFSTLEDAIAWVELQLGDVN